MAEQGTIVDRDSEDNELLQFARPRDLTYEGISRGVAELRSLVLRRTVPNGPSAAQFIPKSAPGLPPEGEL